MVVACRKSPVHFYDIVRILAVPVICSLLAAFGISLLAKFMYEFNVIVRLVINTLVFTVLYGGSVLITTAGRQIVHSMIDALYSLRRKRLGD